MLTTTINRKRKT